MTVTSVNQYRASGGFDSSGRRTWTLHYRAETNSVFDGPLTVIADSRFPSYLSSYSFGVGGAEADALAFRQSITADLVEPGESWTVWEVTAVFSTRGVPAPDQSNVDDPTQLPPEIGGSFIKTLVPLEKDKDDNPVTNTAGDLFVDLLRDSSRSDLVIKKNFSAADFDLDLITSVADHVNMNVFFGKPARTWKFSQFTWRQLYFGTTPYYEAQYGFEVNDDTWDFQPANRGPRFKVGTELHKFTDDLGLEYGDGLGSLDTDGTKLTAPPAVIYYDGNPLFGLDPIKGYKETDFAASLNVPTSLPGI